MIFGIGVDLVRVSRIQINIEKYGDRFARRILHEAEFEEYLASPKKAYFLAKRFAAKEATSKAMGVGFTQGLQFSHISIAHNDSGKPVLHYNGRAKDIVREKRIAKSFVSIADDQDLAIAYVVLTTQEC